MDSGDIVRGYFCHVYYAFADQTVSHVDTQANLTMCYFQPREVPYFDFLSFAFYFFCNSHIQCHYLSSLTEELFGRIVFASIVIYPQIISQKHEATLNGEKLAFFDVIVKCISSGRAIQCDSTSPTCLLVFPDTYLYSPLPLPLTPSPQPTPN